MLKHELYLLMLLWKWLAFGVLTVNNVRRGSRGALIWVSWTLPLLQHVPGASPVHFIASQCLQVIDIEPITTIGSEALGSDQLLEIGSKAGLKKSADFAFTLQGYFLDVAILVAFASHLLSCSSGVKAALDAAIAAVFATSLASCCWVKTALDAAFASPFFVNFAFCTFPSFGGSHLPAK